MKKNILVGQSGGPTAVINGSLYGVVAQAKEHKKDRIDHIYGMINGIICGNGEYIITISLKHAIFK